MTDPVKTCANCGHTQSSGDFCEACGTRLPAAVPVPPAPPATPAPPAATVADEATGVAAAPSYAAAAAGAATAGASAGYAAAAKPAAGPPPMTGHTPPPYAGYSAPQGGGYSPPPPHAAPPRRGEGFWSRFFDLSFEHFITPSIIKVLFIIAMVVIGLGVLAWIIVGFVAFGALGIFTLIGALIGGFLYLLMARVFLEMVVVFFRIRDDTEELTRLKR